MVLKIKQELLREWVWKCLMEMICLVNYYWQQDEAEINFSKAQISKIIQSEGFFGSLLGKLAGPIMKVAVPLAKNILAQLRITAAASAIDAGIQKEHGSGTTTLIISNKEMNYIIEIVQALEDSNILFKGVTKIIKNETKGQNCLFP